MNLRRITCVYVGFLFISVLALKIGWVIPDGAANGSYDASLILDGDLNFWNQYTTNGIITQNSIHASTITAKGYVCMLWPVGAPMLWMFFWIIGHGITLLSGTLGQPWTPNGFTIYYNLAVKFATAIMGFSALIMNFFIAKKYVPGRSAMWGIIVVTFGTPFYWYLFIGGDQSHIPAAFVISLFLLTWDAYRTGSRESWNGFLLGLLGGLAAIVKPNHIVIFLFPLAMWIAESRKNESKKHILPEIIMVAAGSIFALSLQFWIWNILFGNPLGPIMEKGITHYYGFFEGKFWLLDVLFSSYHGLFFFSPVLIFSFYGLYRLIRIDGMFAIPSLVILLFQILLMANERFLWEGAAFGLRRIADWTPVLAIGLAVAMQRLKGSWKIIPVAATLWTIFLVLTYSSRPLGMLNEYQSPAVVLNWQWATIREFPSILKSIMNFPAPPKIFLPAFLIFAIPGFLVFYGCLRLSESQKTSKTLLIILLCLFTLTYGLVSRAALRGSASLEKSKAGLEWLARNQDRLGAAEEVTFLLSEGKYIALSRNWNEAKPSFEEALSKSPDQRATAGEIRRFANAHLSSEDADAFLKSLSR